MTARMLAWKQPFIQRVRNSSLVEGLGVDNSVTAHWSRDWAWIIIGY